MELSHISVEERVNARLKSVLSRLSHAYMISGASEQAVDLLSRRLAAAYVCTGAGDRPCGVCSGCRKAKGNIHPDIIEVKVPEDKRIISVDQIRQVRAEAYIRPNEAERKVFIIRDAQAMNDSAQNALLKVLEDGPAYLAFLLLTENPEQLLPTIRSRCESLSLAALPEEEGSILSEELQSAAAQLAKLLLHGKEQPLIEFTVGLELKKWEKDALLAFFDAVEEALRQELLDEPKRVLAVLERLKQARQAALFNVGTGHLLGWLAAKCES